MVNNLTWGGVNWALFSLFHWKLTICWSIADNCDRGEKHLLGSGQVPHVQPGPGARQSHKGFWIHFRQVCILSLRSSKSALTGFGNAWVSMSPSSSPRKILLNITHYKTIIKDSFNFLMFKVPWDVYDSWRRNCQIPHISRLPQCKHHEQNQ